MDLGIAEKTALVLAGGGGLGSGIARALAAEGVKVAVAGRTIDSVATAADSVLALGGYCKPFVCDLAELSSIDELVESVVSSVGQPDILINLTGGPPPSESSGIDPHAWTTHFDSMIRSVIYTTDLLLPAMRKVRWGRVITGTSSGVIAPIPNLMMSNALRGTLLGWSKTLSRDVAIDGVTVNVVVPGRISTKRIIQLDAARAAREGRDVEEVEKESSSSIPVGRYGTDQEFGAAVAFLASQQASYINGSVIRIDGGLIPSI